MPTNATWPAVLIMIALLVLVRAPWFGPADTPPTQGGGRITTLDGLRGFLALAVFFHHAAIYRTYIADGHWAAPASRVYAMLGPVGVAFFFMITGFLFWGKLLVEGGQPNWLLLYLGRIFRIGPLYVTAVVVLIIIVFARSNWQLYGTLFGLVKGCAMWLALGAFGPGPDINHLHDTWIIFAGVTWTLQYEWRFYAALLPLSLVVRFARGRYAALFCFGGFLAGCLLTALAETRPAVIPPVVFATLFCAGMVTASIRAEAWVRAVPPFLASTLAAALIAAPFLLYSTLDHVAVVALLAAAFVLIASGCDLFGLLSTHSARRLGDISYGIYLLQGLVLATVFAPPEVRAFALRSDGRFWLVILTCAVILTAVATLAFVAVERPGIAWGRAVGRRLKRLRGDAGRASLTPPRSRRGLDALWSRRAERSET